MSIKLLFVDIEATGLDPAKDEIIEFAAIVTDEHLTEHSRFAVAIKPSPDGFQRLLNNPKVLDMHRSSGLFDELLDIQDSHLESWTNFVNGLQVFVNTAFNYEWKKGLLSDNMLRGKLLDTVHLAGSGVAAYDRKFIDHHLAWLSTYLHYASIDVGPSRRLWQWTTGTELTGDEGQKAHRAMADVEGHLNEARAVREKFLAAQAAA